MRKTRELKKGAKYHASAKINRGEHIFETDQIKTLFLEIVRRSKKKYKYLLENFTIMNNHIHLFMRRFYYNIMHKLKEYA